MTEGPETYLAVLKAAYDYDPQPEAEDEIAIKENQILLLIEKVDDDWWKVKVKQDDDGPMGLVPAAYVEPHEHTSIVKAQYDYDAQESGELSIKENEMLYVYDKDDAWLLVHSQKPGGKVGFVPENYVTDIVEGTEDALESTVPEPVSLSQIVIPPSPPRPSAPYVDPEALVAASSNKSKADIIETWAVSEVDKKGKKKKGTLGIGNGAVFFASESDKTPVQKWQTSILQSAHIEKSKHVIIEVGGPSPANLHYNAGSKDSADAIVAKLKASKELSLSSSSHNDVPERPRSGAAKSVHFDASPAIIPPREPSEGDDEEVQQDALGQTDGEPSVALYDFTADGEDELSIREGESLFVLERDADDWWKVRNSHGAEGVVPASYVELSNQPATSQRDEEEEEARRAAEEEESRRRAEEAVEAAKKEAQKEAAAQREKAAAAAADADRRRREQERAAKAKEKQAERERERERERELTQRAASQRPSSSSDRPSSSGKQANSDSGTSRNSSDRRGPPSDKTRIWHDRTGQFRVEAAFLGFAEGKLRLHKVNGVIIEVPSEKMSPEDIHYVETLTNKRPSKPSSANQNSDDDEPLASRRRSLREVTKPPPKKGPKTDWFDFFLTAGCDLDDCTRYAASFERDKIDESILSDITEGTMRSLGLREGDIIRVKKEIDKRNPKDKTPQEQPEPTTLSQTDETAGRNSPGKRNTVSPAPNLFAGPNGALKNNTQRRGRPQPSKSLPPTTVDITAISSASDQIQRTSSPSLITSASPVQAPPRTSSALVPVSTGFDDDAWTNRPSSTKPLTPTPSTTVTGRAPSAPPVPTLPPTIRALSPPIAASQSLPTPTPQSQTPSKGLASTTENDVFEQLARLSQLRTQSPAVTPPAALAQINRVSPVVSPPPRSFTSGMGMGSSPVPMGQLQPPSIGVPMQQNQMTNGPRGPFAPVPANQSLLQPLIPTTTGFNSFIPTRPVSNSSQFQPAPQNFLSPQSGPVMSNPTGFQPSFQTSQTQLSGFQPLGLQSQPTGFRPLGSQPQPTGFQPLGLQSQPTGFQPLGLRSQPTGFQPSGNMMLQPAGALGGNNFGNLVPQSSLPNSSFGQIQSNPTGFNPGFGQSPFGNNMSVPSAPPLPTSNSVNSTAPANVFAQMKAGTFASNNDSVPQSSDKYDALRPNPLVTQPTGWFAGPGNYGAF